MSIYFFEKSRTAFSKATGISERVIASYDLEGRYPRNRKVYAVLADVLDCDINYLLTEDEEFIISADAKYGSRGARQASELVNELSGMFAGGELSESDMDAVMIALQNAYFKCKEDNRKYTPKKYRKSMEE